VCYAKVVAPLIGAIDPASAPTSTALKEATSFYTEHVRAPTLYALFFFFGVGRRGTAPWWPRLCLQLSAGHYHGGASPPKAGSGRSEDSAAATRLSRTAARPREWGMRLSEAMLAESQTAYEKSQACKTATVSYLMADTGSTRSSVRTWLQNGPEVPRLGRPTVFTDAEEATIASATELWTESRGLLTREMMADTLPDYVAETGPKRLAQAKECFGDNALPGKDWFSSFLSRGQESRRVKAAGLDEDRAMGPQRQSQITFLP